MHFRSRDITTFHVVISRDLKCCSSRAEIIALIFRRAVSPKYKISQASVLDLEPALVFPSSSFTIKKHYYPVSRSEARVVVLFKA